MKLEYFPDTDTLYLTLKQGPGTNAEEVAPNVVLDYNAEREVIGVEIEQASKMTELDNAQLSVLRINLAA